MSSQTLIPTLHHLSSSQSFRVLFAFEELNEAHGVQYQLEKYQRSAKRAPETLKGPFPLGKAPIITLEENGAPAKEIYQLQQYPGILTESRLILQFMSDTWGNGMWEAQTETDKRQDVFMQEFSMSTLASKCNFAVTFESIPPQLPWGLRHVVSAMIRPVVNYWKADIRPVMELLEETLTEERPWFSGAKLGLADINMVWPIDVAWQRDYFDKEKYPKVAKWFTTIRSRPAWKRALEKGGSYNLVTFE